MTSRAQLDRWNLGALVAAFALAVVAALLFTQVEPRAAPASAGVAATSVTDATGVAVPVRDYRRIVSVVPQLDEAAAAIGLLDRFAAVTAHTRAHSPFAPQVAVVGGTVPMNASVETLLGLRPDLVLLSAFSDAGMATRLRASGLAVYRCGEERGAATAAANAIALATLCGENARGAAAAATFQQRLARVADPAWPRRPACYVSIYDARLFGGSAGTSYADVLAAAGFTDAAAAAGFSEWPQYQSEDLIRIAPEVIVTGTGMAAALRALPAAARVPALHDDRIIELDDALLSSPGFALLDAAEAVARGRGRMEQTR